MSQFEFILIIISIVAGFAISEMLAGIGRSLRKGVVYRHSGLHYLAVLVLLFLATRYIWTLWDYRSLQWVFWNFLLLLFPVFAIALAARVISVPANSVSVDLQDHYFANSGAFYSLLIVLNVSWAFSDFVNLAHLREVIASDNFLIVRFGAAAFGLVQFSWLAYTRRPSHHWVLLTGTVAYLLYASFQTLTTLPE